MTGFINRLLIGQPAYIAINGFRNYERSLNMSYLQSVRQLADIKNVVRIEHNSLFQSIGYVLTNHWDPLDIGGPKSSNDSYYRYVPKVYAKALKSKNTAELAQYLSFLSTDVLGEHTNARSDKHSARIIMAVRDYYLSNVI
jgi:hypothetical protein